MQFPFFKYQGTGNDFVIIDQRETQFLKKGRDEAIVEQLCDRKFGIGADGLMLLEKDDRADFKMVYFNSDGNESTMCGNGGRCITHFAHHLGIFKTECSFIAIDGLHLGKVISQAEVAIQMTDVDTIEAGDGFYVLDTGSPHYVTFVEDVSDLNIKEQGAAIRYSKPFRAEGINVNFVENIADGIDVATYERGVEDETLSCGTGVTAAAIAKAFSIQKIGDNSVPITVKGGKLRVSFKYDGNTFTDVWLQGPATPVFEGVFTLK